MGQSVGQQLKWGLQLGAGVCLIGAGIAACMLPMVTFSAHHLNLDQEGVRTTAKVTQKHTFKGSGSTPAMRGVGGVAASAAAGARIARTLEARKNGQRVQGVYDEYEVDYTYTANGQQLFGVQGLSRDTYENLRVGGDVAVVYHPAAPSVHRLPEFTVPFENSSLLKRILIALFSFPLGAFTLYRGAMNALGRTAAEKAADAKLDRIAPPVNRIPVKAAAGGSPQPKIEPRRPVRKPGQFGTRARV